MKRAVALLLLSALLLAGCSSLAPAASPDAAPGAPAESAALPEPTPEPTPEPPVSLVLHDESAEEILALAAYADSLRAIDATASREYEALVRLRELLPDCEIRYQVPFQGRLLPGDLRELSVEDPQGLEEILPFLPELEKVDMSACRLDTEQMDRLFEGYPQIDFLWTLRFGNWEVRSDITCFSSLRTGENYRYNEQELYPLLRYCRHLRALDLGHNDLRDISLIGRLPELQVLILADNPNLTDASPLGQLSGLCYLELFLCWDIQDFSWLESLPNMLDLNLSYCRNLSDPGFIDSMPLLENCWMRSTMITRESIASYRETRPEITFVVGSPSDVSAVCLGWREKPRNMAIRRAFTKWRQVEDFRSWDDVDYVN